MGGKEDRDTGNIHERVSTNDDLDEKTRNFIEKEKKMNIQIFYSLP